MHTPGCSRLSGSELHVYHHTFFKWRVEGCCENFNRLIQLWQNVWLAYFHSNKWVFRFIIQVQVFRFRYSDSVFRFSIQVWSCLGIQAQYSGLCLCTHIQYSYSGSHVQVFRFRIQVWVYIQAWVCRLADIKYSHSLNYLHINTECEYTNTNLNTEPELPNMSAHT